MLTFDRNEDIKNIFAIEEILHMKVQIEAVKRSSLIPQCKKCQSYGHTQNYCNKTPRCVKCVGIHATKECKKPKETPPKCVNCGDPHPANYRGCTVGRELQRIRNKTNGQSIISETSNRPIAQRTTRKDSNVNPNVTFAEMATRGTQDNQNADPTNKMLQVILNRLDSQEQRQEKALAAILKRLSQLENNRKTSEVFLSS